MPLELETEHVSEFAQWKKISNDKECKTVLAFFKRIWSLNYILSIDINVASYILHFHCKASKESAF